MRSEQGVDPGNAAERLIGALASTLGTDLSFDKDQQCALLFEGGVELIISVNSDCTVMTLRAPLCAAEPAARLRKALALNYGEVPPGFAIALDSRSGQLLLLAQMPLASATENGFVRAAEQLLGLVAPLLARLAETTEAGTDASPDIWRYGAGNIRG